MRNYSIVLPKITKRVEAVEVGKVEAGTAVSAIRKAADEWPKEVKGLVDVTCAGPKKGTVNVKRFRVTREGRGASRSVSIQPA